jgi:hypothetical protein
MLGHELDEHRGQPAGRRSASPARMPAGPTLALGGSPVWCLGFDCATATFAFSLARVVWPAPGATTRALARVRGAGEILRRARALCAAGDQAAASALAAELAPILAAYERESCAIMQIVDGETANLCPGWANKDIPTVLRICSLVKYVTRRVLPAVAAHLAPPEPLRVLIEFQKEANVPARKIMYALVALFAAHDPIIVGPSLKNKVATCEEGRYCYFAARYEKTYDANKAHAKFNFAHIERVFGSGIPASSASLRGHIADSFMQVVGHVVHGGSDEHARARY